MQSLAGWRRLQDKGTTYIMKKSDNQNLFKIVVTDLINVWVKESAESELLKAFQELNPLIECSDCAVVHKIWSLVDTFLAERQGLSSASSSMDVIVGEDNFLQLKFRTVMDGHTFKLHFYLPQENAKIFFKEVTMPLLFMAEELFVRQDSLCSLLEKKDTEITQYKVEGACLQRQSVETQPFARREFFSQPQINLSSENPFLGLFKILDAANTLSVPDPQLGAEALQSDSLNDGPGNGSRERDRELAVNVTSKALECDQDECNVKVDVKAEVTESSGSAATETVKRESTASRIPKKKKPKLNL